MNCSKCGQPIDPGASFCGNCGQAVVLSPVAPVTPSPILEAPAPVLQNTQPPQPAIQQSQATMTQVLQNPAPTQPLPLGNPVMSTVGNVSPTIPAYAHPSSSPKGERKSIIALIFGVIGIPASLIPLLGIACGVTGLILASTSRRQYKHAVNTLAIIFSSVAIVVALGSWVLIYQQNVNSRKSGTAASSITSNPVASSKTIGLNTINTPCYSVSIDSGLNSYSPSGCNFDSEGTNQEYTVSTTTNVTVTKSNFDSLAKQWVATASTSTGTKINSENAGIFAGSPAYIATAVNSSNTQNMIMAVILHPSANGQNIFIAIHAITGSNVPTFGPLETNWVWK